MNSGRNQRRKFVLFTAAGVAVLLVSVHYLHRFDRCSAHEELLLVLQSYLKASYARDFKQAYHYISSQDQKVRREESYVQEKGAYSGFTLQLAKQLAEAMEIRVFGTEQTIEGVRITVQVKLPAAEDLSPVVYGWDSDKLNSLTPTQQHRILEELTKLKQSGKLTMVVAQETYDLIKEANDWRVFFDWASGVKIAFGFSAPPSSGIEAQFSEKQLITKIGEPFQIVFKIKNRSSREVAMKVGHLIEPPDIREHLEMIQCGLLSPMALSPGNEQEMSSIYILTGEFPENVKDVTIKYVFKPEK
jgi:Cytochrome c oxidase assembly protein CtaG/Cox11